jgi:hypothetical protein
MSAYEDERREIRKIQGRKFGFTYADWTVKFLLGSRVTEWDSLDERRLTKQQLAMIQKFGNSYLGIGGGAAAGAGGGEAGVIGGSGAGGRGKDKDKKCTIM